MNEIALACEGIVKRYPTGNTALSEVSLTVRAGEIHALVGENGAGKTTLARIAAGEIAPTQGRVTASGAVGLVHQHPALAGRLPAWENIVLGAEPQRGAMLNERAARERVTELSRRSGLTVDPDAIVEDLPIGIVQRVEILRALSREPAVLLLDEPTAVLAPAEIATFFSVVRGLAQRGIGILIITHKLSEVIAHTQRVTVLRGGRMAAAFETARTSIEEIARAMVGGDPPPTAARTEVRVTPLLELREVRAGEGAHALHEASFAVGGGEIVGVAGVEGNGQTPLADAIAGIIPYGGTIHFAEDGLRVIPQDARRTALVPGWSIVENVALGAQRRAFSRGRVLNRTAMRERAQAIAERFDLRAPSLDAPVAALSGGNQQKIVVGRALLDAPRLVLAYQPTHGIDLGAAALVHSRLIEARNAGVGVLLISFDLDELLALADRILVLYRGSITAAFERDAFDRARIGAYMAGAV